MPVPAACLAYSSTTDDERRLCWRTGHDGEVATSPHGFRLIAQRCEGFTRFIVPSARDSGVVEEMVMCRISIAFTAAV